jgi:uncharacterized membrane protein
MNAHLSAAVAAARRADLQRAAGCCTALIEQRRTAAREVGRRLTLSLHRRPAAQPMVCCA